MMATLNKPAYCLIVLLGFLCLCAYAWPYKEPGYSQREIDRVGEIALGDATDRKTEAVGVTVPPSPEISGASPATNAEKMVYLYGDEGEKP